MAALFAAPWVPVWWSMLPVRRTLIDLLVALQIVYVIVLACSLFGAAALGTTLWRARRTQTKRPMVARLLLLCCACILSLSLAEAMLAVRHAPVKSAPGAAPSVDPLLPTTFAEAKDGSEVNLVVLGESSAAGVPYDQWLSIGRIVAWQLGRVLPEKRVRVDVLAVPGDTLEGQHQKLSEIKRRPDAVIVYCGHNEFFSRIGWSWRRPYYSDDPPSSAETIGEFAGRVSPLLGLVRQAADRFRIGIIPTTSFKPELVDVPAFNATEYNALLADFRRRLEAITTYSEQIGALPVLLVPPANDAGFEPIRSFLPPTTPRAEREAFAREFRAARHAELSDSDRAIKLYRRLLAGQPGFAEAHYRLAQLLEKTSNWNEAYEHYVAARDLDGMPVRSPTAFQQVYRDLAASHGCALVDGQSLFHSIGPNGMLNDTLFHDSVHPTLRGQIALAQELVDVFRQRRSFGWPPGVPSPLIESAECASHFGLGSAAWTAVCEWGNKFYRFAEPLRHDPGHCREMARAYTEALQRLQKGEQAEQILLLSAGIANAQ